MEMNECIPAYFDSPGSFTLLVSGDFCRLLKTFANVLDLDQDRQNVGPDLDPNRSTLW